MVNKQDKHINNLSDENASLRQRNNSLSDGNASLRQSNEKLESEKQNLWSAIADRLHLANTSCCHVVK